MKRSRRGGRRPQNGHNGHNGGGGGGGYNPNRTYDSNGPEVKIRGSASHIYEKYLQLARDTNAAGDRVMAENYLQHAEHYYRIMAVSQAQMQQNQAVPNNNGQPRPPGGSEEQPYVPANPIPQPSSGPSFSLTDNTTDEDEGEEESAPE